MATDSEGFMEELREKVQNSHLVWLLPLLVGVLGGILVVSPRPNVSTLALVASAAALLFWVLSASCISVFAIEKRCFCLVFIGGLIEQIRLRIALQEYDKVKALTHIYFRGFKSFKRLILIALSISPSWFLRISRGVYYGAKRAWRSLRVHIC